MAQDYELLESIYFFKGNLGTLWTILFDINTKVSKQILSNGNKRSPLDQWLIQILEVFISHCHIHDKLHYDLIISNKVMTNMTVLNMIRKGVYSFTQRSRSSKYNGIELTQLNSSSHCKSRFIRKPITTRYTEGWRHISINILITILMHKYRSYRFFSQNRMIFI